VYVFTTQCLVNIVKPQHITAWIVSQNEGDVKEVRVGWFLNSSLPLLQWGHYHLIHLIKKRCLTLGKFAIFTANKYNTNSTVCKGCLSMRQPACQCQFLPFFPPVFAFLQNRVDNFGSAMSVIALF